jgi:HSP20 family molecular chaperone IbpA
MQMWNPWHLFDELERDFTSSSMGTIIDENEDETTIEIDVPGLTEDDLDITVTGTLLSVRGERKGKRPVTFARSFQLGDVYDLDRVKAHVANGVLTITLAKAEQAKPRRIKLTGGVVDKVKGLLSNKAA